MITGTVCPHPSSQPVRSSELPLVRRAFGAVSGCGSYWATQHPSESLQSQSFFLGYESTIADFPDTTLFYGLEAAHLGVLMRLRYSCPGVPQRALGLTHPFSRTLASPKTALTWAVFLHNGPALCLGQIAGPSCLNEKRHCSTELALVSGRGRTSDLDGSLLAGEAGQLRNGCLIPFHPQGVWQPGAPGSRPELHTPP